MCRQIPSVEKGLFQPNTFSAAFFRASFLLLLFVVCCSHINSHNQVRGHRAGPSHSGVEDYPRKKIQTNHKWYTNMSQLTQFMPPPEKYKKVKSGVSRRRARSVLIHTPQNSRLKNRLHRMPPRKDYHDYIARITYHAHTHGRLKSIEKTRKIKQRKEREKETK